MRKLFIFLRGSIIAASLVFFTSCEKDNIDYEVSEESGSGSLWLFASYDNFLVGKDTANFQMLFTGKHFFQGDHVPHGIPISFVDYRLANGKSNWSDPRIDVRSYDWDDYEGGWYFYSYYQGSVSYLINVNSPPAHLHLCLRTWDENPKGTRPGRTWKAKAIIDDQGKDLSNDPDWASYTDNTMRFEKTDRFVLTVGQKRTEKEEEIFGSYPKNDVVYGTYSFVNITAGLSRNKLSLVFPNLTRVVEVTESTFGRVILKVTEKNKTGFLVLEPVD
jgi:hypothetical protein